MLFVSLLMALPVTAKLDLHNGWVKAYLQTTDPAVAQAIASDAGGQVVWRYLQNTLVYVPSFDRLAARAQQSQIAVSPLQIEESIYVNNRALDPRYGLPAGIPDEQLYASYPPLQKGLYVIQFAGPIESTWVAELDAMGVKQVEPIPNRAMIVVSTPENISQVDLLPYVQFRDFLHPFLKDGSDADPYRYYKATFRVAPVDDAEKIARELKALAVARTPTGECFRGLELQQAAAHPLVVTANVGASEVDVHGTLPADAPPGHEIIVWVSGDVDDVFFGQVPASRFSRLDADRLLVQVPPELPPGPAEISVSNVAGWRQVLQSGETRGFRVGTEIGRLWFSKGDVIVSTATQASFNTPPLWDVRWISQDGDLRVRRHEEADFLYFGTRGLLNTIGYRTSSQFDARLDIRGVAPSVLGGATALITAADGSAWVARSEKLIHYASDGTTELAAVPLASVRALDLDTDQCTLAYLSSDLVGLYDLCRRQAIGEVMRNSGARAVKFLPDGTLLVGGSGTWRVTRQGALLAVTQTPVTAIAISPDATFAWLGSGDMLYRYDLLTNRLISPTAITIRPMGAVLNSLAVYGEWTAARGPAIYADDPVIDAVVGLEKGAGGRVFIQGRGFVQGATVTIGGLEGINAEVPSPLGVAFTMPPGTLGDRNVIVINPNGMRATFELPAPPSSGGGGRRRAVRP